MALTMFHVGECGRCGRDGETLLGLNGLCDRCLVEQYEGEVSPQTIAIMLACYGRARNGWTSEIADFDVEELEAVS